MKKTFCTWLGLLVVGLLFATEDAKFIYPQNPRLELSYQSDNCRHKFYLCYANGKVGIVDDRENVIVPIEYDKVQRRDPLFYIYFIWKGDKVGLINGNGEWLIPPVLCKIDYTDYNKYAFTECDGHVESFDNEESYYDELPMWGAYYARKYHCPNVFYLNPARAKEVLVDAYSTTGAFNEGLMPIRDIASNKLGFLDHDGNWAIPYKIPCDEGPIINFTDTIAFSGGYLVMKYSDKYQVYNKKGDLLLTIEKNKNSVLTQLSKFAEGGFALKRVQTGYRYDSPVRLQYISPTGKEMFPGIYAGKVYTDRVHSPDEYIRPMRDERAAYADFNAKWEAIWGFFDKDGRIVVKAKYNNVHNYSEGLAAVQMREDDENALKWGFIDKAGNWVIPPRFSNEPNDFHEGLALVKKTNRMYVFINRQGQVVGPEWLMATPFLNGRAFVEFSPAPYVYEYYAVNHDFVPVACYLPETVLKEQVRKQIYKEVNSSYRPHSEVVVDNILSTFMISTSGEHYFQYSTDEFFFKGQSEGVIHVKYGAYPNIVDVFCNKRGKVLFLLRKNEF